MSSSLIVADRSVQYEPKEGVILVVAAAWLIMIGSATLAAIILCGWRGAKSIHVDWKKMQATFVCR